MLPDNKNKKLQKLQMPAKRKKGALDLASLHDGDDEDLEDEQDADAGKKYAAPGHDDAHDMYAEDDDQAPEGSEEEESQETPEEEADEQHAGDHKLSECADEDLLAEVRKRGLMKQLQGGSKQAGPEEDHDYSMA